MAACTSHSNFKRAVLNAGLVHADLYLFCLLYELSVLIFCGHLLPVQP